jgi:RHS repeat-associated protein
MAGRRPRRVAASAALLATLLLIPVTALAGGPTSTGAPPKGAGGGSVQALSLGAPMVLPQNGTILVQTHRTLTAASINDLSLSQPSSQFLVADASHVSTTVVVGTFTAGTNLVFSLHSSFTNQNYLSTGDHAVVTQDGIGRWTVGWEDWSDFNYNDAIMVVCYQTATPGCPLPSSQTFGVGFTGNGTMPQALQAEPVNTASGNYVTHATDATLPGRGLGFAFGRTYNSLNTDIGTLGVGWTSSYSDRVVPGPSGSATFIGEDGARATYAGDGAGGFLRPPGAYGILNPVAGGGFELKRRDQVRLAFDASGKLLSQTDRNGNTLTLHYTSGQLTSITDTVGRSITLGYNAQARLESLTFPPSRTVTYQYDASDRLWKVTDPELGVTTFTYDAQNRLATITDANNHQVVENIYGPDGRVAEQIDARDYHTFFDWDPVTQISTMTDARGGEWIDRYNSGVLVSQSDPLGNTTQFSFDANLGLAATVDANGRTWATETDSFGNTLRKKYPGPGAVQEIWTYNSRNDPLTHVDRRVKTTTYTYDSAGNLKTMTGPSPVSPLTTYNYDPTGTGLLTSVIDPRGKTTLYGYDASANRDRVTTPLGNVTTMVFDTGGRMTSLVEPRGNVVGADPAQFRTTFTHDALDRVRTVTSPLGHVTMTEYDGAGNRMSVTDANSHPTTFAYDEANHLTSVTDADLKGTSYTYDEVGNVVSRTDANDHLTTYAYDLAGRLTTETRPLGRVWTYTHSPTGKIKKVVDPIAAATPDPNDFQVTFTYDERDRLTVANYGASGSVTHGYNENDRRTSVGNTTGTASFLHDDLDRLVIYRFAGQGIDYTYDAAGNVTRRTYLDGTVVDLAYDDDGRLSTVTSGGATTSYGYDAAGNLTSTTLPSGNGYVDSRTYDRSGRLTEVKSQKGAAVLARATYGLDPVGNRLSMQTTAETVTYQYDELNRLTEACYTPTCTGGTEPFRRYTYDPVGNRLTEARSAGTTTYSYDALDQLTQTTGFGGTVNYTYDLDGRSLTAGAASSTWTRQGWLATRTQGGTTTTYSYNGDGLRFEASTGTQASKKTRFDWDPSGGLPQLVAERNGSSTLLRRYVNGLDTISLTAGNKVGYFHYDGLGSVVNLTSSTGVTWWTYSYLPYGGIRTETKNNSQAADNVLRFGGEYLDPTALYYLRARAYDSGTGRFVSPDPADVSVTEPYLATYHYAMNNPVRLTDPSGRDTAGLCVNGEGAWGFIFGEGALCIVVSETGQFGVIGVGGTGGGVGLGVAAGMSVLASSAEEIYDLEGPFLVTGASGAFGAGWQAEGFSGPGHCGDELVGGLMTGPVVGATGSLQVGGTWTEVLVGFGAPESECGGEGGK